MKEKKDRVERADGEACESELESREETKGNSILGPRMTPDEIRRAREREKQRRRQERRASRSTPMLVGFILFLVVVLAGVGTLIFFGVRGSKLDRDTSKGYFTRLEDEPEMSEEGIKGVVREAYYTKDGHMAVVLQLSNGLNTNHYLTFIEVELYNADGELIASGKTDQIPEDFYIQPMSTAPFTFYISPEYVELPDDDLQQLTYEINTRGQLEDPDVQNSAA